MRNGWNWKYPLSYMYPAYTQLVAKCSSPSIGDRRATGWSLLEAMVREWQCVGMKTLELIIEGERWEGREGAREAADVLFSELSEPALATTSPEWLRICACAFSAFSIWELRICVCAFSVFSIWELRISACVLFVFSFGIWGFVLVPFPYFPGH